MSTTQTARIENNAAQALKLSSLSQDPLLHSVAVVSESAHALECMFEGKRYSIDNYKDILQS